MKAFSTHKVSLKPVLTEYFQTHGADVRSWPKGWKKAIEERTGGSMNAIGACRARMAKTWPGDQPHPTVIHDLKPDPPAVEASSEPDALLTARHHKTLEKAAISPNRIKLVRTVEREEDLSPELRRWGDRVLPAMEFTWKTVTGETVHQIRLNNPITGKDGHQIRYLFGDGVSGLIGVDPAFADHQDDTRIPAMLVEGTKQFLAAASALEDGHPSAIPFGMPGCWGWSSDEEPCDDLRAMALANRDVLVAFDADLQSNPMVFLAARRLEGYLEGEFLARSVRFLVIPGGAKDGLDDLLGRQPTPERRMEVMRNLITKAIELPKKGPRMPSKNSGFFDQFGNFKPVTCWDFLAGEHDLAMAADRSIAVYSGGVFWNGDSLKFRKIVCEALTNHYKPEHENTLLKFGLAELKVAGVEIPFRQPRLILNFLNGLLDVETMKLQPHTPSHRTLIQFPFNWDPAAECPTFDGWLKSVLPNQGDVLLDVSSQMLDQTRQPTQLLFLYGPSRSGKSTFLRILRWIAGERMSSSASMHQLATNRFAPARLFGKILNTFADLAADDLKDLSVLKALTGEDALDAENKCQPMFTLENMAMLAFSANAVPAVSETSLAYFARVSAFHFDRTFLGREDASIEDRMRAELQGIMRRMVAALRERKNRGRFLAADQSVQEEFARQSDRVRLFLSECTKPCDRSSRCIKRSELYPLFCDWLRAETDGRGRAMGKQKFNAKVRSTGVEEFKPEGGSWAWNLLQHDPETAEEGGPRTAEPDKGLTVVVNADNNSPVLSSSEAEMPSKSAEEEKPVLKGDQPDLAAKNSPISAIPPYCPPIEKTDQKFPGTQQCSESAETAEVDSKPVADLQQLSIGAGATQPANPAPFEGNPPTGIDYVCRATDLPDPDAMAMSLGFDLETFNRRTDLWRHKASLSPSLGGEIRLAQLTAADSQTTLVIDVAVIGQPAIDWLATLVRNPERKLIGHNLLFEATYLIAAGIRPLCQWWDTMLACQIIGDLPSNSLAAASAHYLKRELDKTEQTSDWGNALTASQLRYAALDAIVVVPLGRELHTQLHATGQVDVHRLDCSMISACADGQVRGLSVDIEAAASAQKLATAERKTLAAEFHQTLGIENYRSPLKLKPALIQYLGEEIEDTKDRTLKKFRPDPLIEQLLKLKELDQELKEVKWLIEEAKLTDGRVRPNYRIIGASTGRMSTSALIRESSSHAPSDTERFKGGQRKGEPKPVKLGQCGFNFQGITGDRKRALGTGDPNTVLIDLDWSSIEIRLQASSKLYNDCGQRKILLDGIDPHAYIASQACGREIKKDENGKWPKERETIGKRANFSLAYGCGVAGLRKLLSRAQGQQVTHAEAQKVYDAWHRFHPQISRQMRKFDGANVREVRSLAGRRMTFRDHKTGPDGIRPMRPLGRTNGINFPVQGSGRDLLAAALSDLWPALDRFPGVHIVGLIHDELLIEVPRDLVDEVKAIALAAMTSQKLQDQYLGDIPLEADCNVAETWGDAH